MIQQNSIWPNQIEQLLPRFNQSQEGVRVTAAAVMQDMGKC
jgi:hypothetical protein